MKARTIRKTILCAAAVAAVSFPLLTLAGGNPQDANDSILKSEKIAVTNDSTENLYARLQDQSRDVCGSSNIRMTGDLRRSHGNDKCYEGTLSAAVQRLDAAGLRLDLPQRPQAGLLTLLAC